MSRLYHDFEDSCIDGYVRQEGKVCKGAVGFPSSSGRLFEGYFSWTRSWKFGHSGRPPARLQQLSARKKRPITVPASQVPRIVIDTQIEHWIRWTLESNIALTTALKRLRDSYMLLQAGKAEQDADEILAQVEAALETVEKSSM